MLPEWQWSYDGWIVLVTSLVAVICAIPGSFLLVLRQAMLGDAISHAVLPGIAIGFLISGDRGGGWMLSGAIIAGLTTTVLTQFLRGIAGVERGAALGVGRALCAPEELPDMCQSIRARPQRCGPSPRAPAPRLLDGCRGWDDRASGYAGRQRLADAGPFPAPSAPYIVAPICQGTNS